MWAGTMDGKPVAVKRAEIDESYAADVLGLEAAKNQFANELSKMTGLEHRNVIGVLAFNTYHDGCGYTVMPKMDCDLKRFVPTATTGRELLGVLLGALEGLKYVHENGHCHALRPQHAKHLCQSRHGHSGRPGTHFESRRGRE